MSYAGVNGVQKANAIGARMRTWIARQLASFEAGALLDELRDEADIPWVATHAIEDSFSIKKVLSNVKVKGLLHAQVIRAHDKRQLVTYWRRRTHFEQARALFEHRAQTWSGYVTDYYFQQRQWWRPLSLLGFLEKAAAAIGIWVVFLGTWQALFAPAMVAIRGPERNTVNVGVHDKLTVPLKVINESLDAAVKVRVHVEPGSVLTEPAVDPPVLSLGSGEMKDVTLSANALGSQTNPVGTGTYTVALDFTARSGRLVPATQVPLTLAVNVWPPWEIKGAQGKLSRNGKICDVLADVAIGRTFKKTTCTAKIARRPKLTSRGAYADNAESPEPQRNTEPGRELLVVPWAFASLPVFSKLPVHIPFERPDQMAFTKGECQRLVEDLTWNCDQQQ